jgi:16S rRNA (guanine(966)-N(2))-methyltransferase RsmD
MRIVAGEWRGRRLVAPKGRGVRPTLEMVREAIFDTLGPRVAGSRVLDLFAGCGALGLEALSRGASHVTWCDSSDRSIAAVRENASKLGVPASAATVLHMPAHAAIARLSRAGETFDIVFLDPPYEGGLYEETMLALGMGRVVARGGLVAVEHARRIEVDPVFGDLVLKKRRQYGETIVTYFERAREVGE